MVGFCPRHLNRYMLFGENMRQFIFTILIFPLLFLPCLAQDKCFRILSFTLDGKEISEYTISYTVGEKQFIPVREGSKILVPTEVSEASKGTTKFESSGYTFEFPFLMDGYSETDRVKSDVDIGIDNYPFEIEVSNPKFLKKFKTIYFLRGVPTIAPNNPNLIVDPITTIIWNTKKKPKSKN